MNKSVKLGILAAAMGVAAGLACGGSESGPELGTNPFESTRKISTTVTPKFVESSVGGLLQRFTISSDSAAYPAPVSNWTSSNVGIAATEPDASSRGDAYCIARGTVTITATPINSGNVAYLNGTATLQCDSVHADAKAASAGSTPVQATLSNVTSGSAVTNPALAWKSDNPAIASVTTSGLVSPLSPGSIGLTVTQTVDGKTYPVGIGVFFVTGNGSCSLNPSALSTRTLTIKVQSDPGNHAAQIGMPTTATTFGFATGAFAGTNMQIGVSAGAPFVNVSGGWVAPTDCAFVANGMGTVGGQSNVGVRLSGAWSNGALNLTYTVGTNGELSGGATVYSIIG